MTEHMENAPVPGISDQGFQCALDPGEQLSVTIDGSRLDGPVISPSIGQLNAFICSFFDQILSTPTSVCFCYF